MSVYGVFIINRAGSLIYDYEHIAVKVEVEKTLSYPPDFVFKVYDDKVVVAFGQRDGVKVGHTLLAINGIPSIGRFLERPLHSSQETDILKILENKDNFPLDVKFGRPKLSTNEKIMLAGMFHSLFAISCQLSPVPHSSGIQMLETDTFKLHCSQTLTGIKFIAITDNRQSAAPEALLKRLYEVYADFALKNPFYSIDMPIRCEKFDDNLRLSVEQAERSATGGI